MKHLWKPTGLALALILAAAMTCGLCQSAYAAADAPSLDFDRTGSVSVTLKDEDDNVVTDGQVTLYKVADLYLDDGDMAWSYTDSFSGMGTAPDVEDSTLAAALEAYIDENGVTGETAGVDGSGTVSFAGLDLGLYLVVQTEQSDGYYTFSSFLVTVPLAEDGAWDYDVDASPKMAVLTAIPEEETETESSSGGSSGSTGSTLPQTGQLRWPVPVLAGCGAALFLLGWWLRRSKRSHGA